MWITPELPDNPPEGESIAVPVTDNRRTLIKGLSESSAGDEVIMGVAGHVSRATLSRYTHVRMEASGTPSTRSPCASGRQTKSGGRKPKAGSSRRSIPNSRGSVGRHSKSPRGYRASRNPFAGFALGNLRSKIQPVGLLPPADADSRHFFSGGIGLNLLNVSRLI
jgi:hypothetical protein